jgi:hypothetical protein
MKQALIALVALVAMTGTALAQSDKAAMLLRWGVALDAACRGGRDWKVCCEFEKVSLRLNRLGWCYGRPRKIGAKTMRWYRCSRSIGHSPQGFCKPGEQKQ